MKKERPKRPGWEFAELSFKDGVRGKYIPRLTDNGGPTKKLVMSKRTLATLDTSVANFKMRRVSKPVDLSKFGSAHLKHPGGSEDMKR